MKNTSPYCDAEMSTVRTSIENYVLGNSAQEQKRLEAHEFLKQLSPFHRLAEVAEVVDCVLFLESAAFVNGEVIHLDGGAHAGKW
jgi:NAD(P)-dependent dehydrogenase (short-subunit alcohol dehydrogenase family)